MSATPWTIVLVIALGSVAGALLRQALILAVPRFMLTGTAIIGVLFGVAIGNIITSNALSLEEQTPWLIGLIAALGTFGASAVVTTSASPPQATKRLRMAAVHIGLAIGAAACGIGLIHWLRISEV